MTEEKRFTDAHHEAGHAVVGHILGQRILFSAITTKPPSVHWEKHDYCDNDIIKCFAGDVAERILSGETNFEFPPKPTPGEYFVCLDLADIFQQTKSFPDLYHQAVNILQKKINWFAVETLTKELLEKGRIPGEETHLIIETAIKEYMSREDIH